MELQPRPIDPPLPLNHTLADQRPSGVDVLGRDPAPSGRLLVARGLCRWLVQVPVRQLRGLAVDVPAVGEFRAEDLIGNGLIGIAQLLHGRDVVPVEGRQRRRGLE